MSSYNINLLFPKVNLNEYKQISEYGVQYDKGTISADGVHDGLSIHIKKSDDHDNDIIKKTNYKSGKTIGNDISILFEGENVPLEGNLPEKNACYIYDSFKGNTLKGVNNYLDSASTPDIVSFIDAMINKWCPTKNYTGITGINKERPDLIYKFKLFSSEINNSSSPKLCLHNIDFSAFTNYDILFFIYIIYNSNIYNKNINTIIQKINTLITNSNTDDVTKLNFFNIITITNINFLWQTIMHYITQLHSESIHHLNAVYALKQICFVSMNIKQNQHINIPEYYVGFNTGTIYSGTSNNILNIDLTNNAAVETFILTMANTIYTLLTPSSIIQHPINITNKYCFFTSQSLSATNIQKLVPTNSSVHNRPGGGNKDQEISMNNGIDYLINNYIISSNKLTNPEQIYLYQCLKFQGDSSHLVYARLIKDAYTKLCIENNLEYNGTEYIKSSNNQTNIFIVVLAGERPLTCRAILEQTSVKVKNYKEFKTNPSTNTFDYIIHKSDPTINVMNKKTDFLNLLIPSNVDILTNSIKIDFGTSSKYKCLNDIQVKINNLYTEIVKDICNNILTKVIEPTYLTSSGPGGKWENYDSGGNTLYSYMNTKILNDENACKSYIETNDKNVFNFFTTPTYEINVNIFISISKLCHVIINLLKYIQTNDIFNKITQYNTIIKQKSRAIYYTYNNEDDTLNYLNILYKFLTISKEIFILNTTTNKHNFPVIKNISANIDINDELNSIYDLVNNSIIELNNNISDSILDSYYKTINSGIAGTIKKSIFYLYYNGKQFIKDDNYSASNFSNIHLFPILNIYFDHNDTNIFKTQLIEHLNYINEYSTQTKINTISNVFSEFIIDLYEIYTTNINYDNIIEKYKLINNCNTFLTIQYNLIEINNKLADIFNKKKTVIILRPVIIDVLNSINNIFNLCDEILKSTPPTLTNNTYKITDPITTIKSSFYNVKNINNTTTINNCILELLTYIHYGLSFDGTPALNGKQLIQELINKSSTLKKKYDKDNFNFVDIPITPSKTITNEIILKYICIIYELTSKIPYFDQKNQTEFGSLIGRVLNESKITYLKLNNTTVTVSSYDNLKPYANKSLKGGSDSSSEYLNNYNIFTNSYLTINDLNFIIDGITDKSKQSEILRLIKPYKDKLMGKIPNTIVNNDLKISINLNTKINKAIEILNTVDNPILYITTKFKDQKIPGTSKYHLYLDINIINNLLNIIKSTNYNLNEISLEDLCIFKIFILADMDEIKNVNNEKEIYKKIEENLKKYKSILSFLHIDIELGKTRSNTNKKIITFLCNYITNKKNNNEIKSYNVGEIILLILNLYCNIKNNTIDNNMYDNNNYLSIMYNIIDNELNK
jgi:hypothetical protein